MLKYLVHLCSALLLFLLPVTAIGQPDDFVKLRQKWQPNQNDTINIKTGLRLAYTYLNMGQSDSGMLVARQCQQLSAAANYTRGKASALNHIGRAHNYLGHPDSSVIYFNRARVLYKELGDKNREAGVLNNLGIIYKELGQVQKAMTHYMEGLKIKETLHDTEAIANAYTNLGELYNEMKDSVSSLKYQMQALALRKAVGDESGVGASLIALGMHFHTHHNLQQAKQYLAEALRIGKRLGEEESIAIASYNLAELQLKLGQPDSAMELFAVSLNLSRKNNNPKGVAVCLETIGQLNFQKGNIPLATRQLEEAYALAKSMNALDILSGVCENLSKCYEKTGDYKQSLLRLKEGVLLKDSILNLENVRRITSEGLKYEHEKEKLLLQKEQERKEEVAKVESARKNFILGVSVLFLVVVSVFSYTLYKRLIENRKQKKIIEEQRNETLASINYARRIQYALLAHDALLQECLPPHFVLFKPKDIVSGDFYWAVKRHDHVYFAVCDCTGHGVPGAFMSLLNISFLNEAITEKGITSPGKILDHVRQRLIENMDGGKDGMDAILVKLPLNLRDNSTLEYAAANNVPLLVRNNSVVNLQKDRMPVGLGENLTPFNTFGVELQRGDKLYLYTDGYADQFGGPKGKKFMYKQLDQLLVNTSALAPDAQKLNLEQQFDAWKSGLEQIDDVCVAGIFWP